MPWSRRDLADVGQDRRAVGDRLGLRPRPEASSPACTCRSRSARRDSGTGPRCRRSLRAPRGWRSSCPGSSSCRCQAAPMPERPAPTISTSKCSVSVRAKSASVSIEIPSFTRSRTRNPGALSHKQRSGAIVAPDQWKTNAPNASSRRYLAADVVGYSRLMSHDEEGTLRQLKAHLGEIVEPHIAAHRGRIVKTHGRWPAGGFRQRRRGRALRRRHPGRHGRPQLRRSRRQPHRIPHRHQPRAT